MRLMIIGSDKVYAIENFYVKHLREDNIEVNHFCAQTYFYDYYQAGITNKLIYKIGLSSILKKINQLFKKEVEAFKPDIIWVFKGMEIFPESLIWASGLGIKLANYNPDNPFLFTGKGSGNKNVTDSIGLYDLHFTYNLSIKEKLEKESNAKTAYLPFGYEIANSVLEKCRQEKEVVKLCFLGNPDKQRATFIKALIGEGLEIDIYGNNWSRFCQHSRMKVYPAVYRDEYWKNLYRYRVQLNIMRIHNEHSHNMRTFEVPGVGGIELAPDNIEHRLFFEERKEIFLYKNISDCCEKIKEILTLNSSDAKAIRERALEKSVKAGYSYKDRTKQALEVLTQLLHG